MAVCGRAFGSSAAAITVKGAVRPGDSGTINGLVRRLCRDEFATGSIRHRSRLRRSIRRHVLTGLFACRVVRGGERCGDRIQTQGRGEFGEIDGDGVAEFVSTGIRGIWGPGFEGGGCCWKGRWTGCFGCELSES